MDADARLDEMIDRFVPEVAAVAREALSELARRLPGAARLVYDNYNALVIAFAASDRAQTAVCSVALYPRWASLFLVGGPDLPDPEGLLQGKGATMRHVRLTPGLIASAGVKALIDAAAARAETPFDPHGVGGTVIKSDSAKQRPRRPG